MSPEVQSHKLLSRCWTQSDNQSLLLTEVSCTSPPAHPAEVPTPEQNHWMCIWTLTEGGMLPPSWPRPPALPPFWIPPLRPFHHLLLSERDPACLISSCSSNPMGRICDMGKQELCHSYLFKPVWGTHMVSNMCWWIYRQRQTERWIRCWNPPSVLFYAVITGSLCLL